MFVHADDLRELGLADGDVVDLVSEWEDGVERRAAGFRVVPYPTPRGCAAAYYPETNPLVPLDSTADGSNTPTSKSVVVRLEAGTRTGRGAVHPGTGGPVGADDHHKSRPEPPHLS